MMVTDPRCKPIIVGTHNKCGGEVHRVLPMGMTPPYNHCIKCDKNVGYNYTRKND